MNKAQIKFFRHNWKMIVHLLFRTYRFGVNNVWWSQFRSIFGLPFCKRWHLVREYKAMKYRSAPPPFGCAFIPEADFKLLFPKSYSRQQQTLNNGKKEKTPN